MTGISRTSADLDPRRRRILFRAWHRGIREMDLILGQFAEAELATLSEAELDELEAIMGRRTTTSSAGSPEKNRCPSVMRRNSSSASLPIARISTRFATKRSRHDDDTWLRP